MKAEAVSADMHAPSARPATTQPSGLTQALAIFAKDVRSELRNRAAVNSVLLFSVTSLVVIGFAVGVENISPMVKVALLWVVLLFAAFSGLAHVFLHEEETLTVTALRLSAASGAVYAGKLLFNLALLGTIVVVVTPLFVLALNLELPQPVAFVAVVLSGCLGLGAGATIVGAIIAKARGRGALYGALGFPILLPLVIMALDASRMSLLDSAAGPIVWSRIAGLLAFATMVITVSALMFPFIWEE